MNAYGTVLCHSNNENKNEELGLKYIDESMK